MATGEAQEIKKQETLVRFNIISYKTRLRVQNGQKVWICLASELSNVGKTFYIIPPLHKHTVYSESRIIAKQELKKKMKKVGNQSDNVKENSSTVPSDSKDHEENESVEKQIWFVYEYYFKKICKSCLILKSIFTLVQT